MSVRTLKSMQVCLCLQVEKRFHFCNGQSQYLVSAAPQSIFNNLINKYLLLSSCENKKDERRAKKALRKAKKKRREERREQRNRNREADKAEDIEAGQMEPDEADDPVVDQPTALHLSVYPRPEEPQSPLYPMPPAAPPMPMYPTSEAPPMPMDPTPEAPPIPPSLIPTAPQMMPSPTVDPTFSVGSGWSMPSTSTNAANLSFQPMSSSLSSQADERNPTTSIQMEETSNKFTNLPIGTDTRPAYSPSAARPELEDLPSDEASGGLPTTRGYSKIRIYKY